MTIRLSKQEKDTIEELYKTKNFTFKELSCLYPVSSQAIRMLLKRRGFKGESQSILQRKYRIDETFFDNINTQEKAYFLGILYADGYNNTDRYSVNLNLKESDKEILVKLNNLVQPDKPLQFINMQTNRLNGINVSDQYRLVIANKHISKRLVELGCIKTKTFKLKFPKESILPENLYSHFIRGYSDGDGSIGYTKKKHNGFFNLVGTKEFLNIIENILKTELNIKVGYSIRHPERNHNITQLSVGGNLQILTVLDWIYNDCSICLNRKFLKYKEIKKHQKILSQIRLCKIEGCNEKHEAKGLCRKHYRKMIYDTTGF